MLAFRFIRSDNVGWRPEPKLNRNNPQDFYYKTGANLLKSRIVSNCYSVCMVCRVSKKIGFEHLAKF